MANNKYINKFRQVVQYPGSKIDSEIMGFSDQTIWKRFRYPSIALAPSGTLSIVEIVSKPYVLTIQKIYFDLTKTLVM